MFLVLLSLVVSCSAQSSELQALVQTAQDELDLALRSGRVGQLTDDKLWVASMMISQHTPVVLAVPSEVGWGADLWDQAAEMGRGRVLFITLDRANDEALQQLATKYSDPHAQVALWVFQNRRHSRFEVDELEVHALKVLIDRLSYELVSHLDTQDSVTAFLREALQDERAFFLVSLSDTSEAEWLSLNTFADLAMQQGVSNIRIGVCAPHLQCGSEGIGMTQPGSARLFKRSVPDSLLYATDTPERPSPLVHRALANARATQRFFRAGPLAVFPRADDIPSSKRLFSQIAHAKLPLMFVLSPTMNTEESAPHRARYVQLGWDYIGKVVLLDVPPSLPPLLMQATAWWIDQLSTQTDTPDASIVLCKFLGSHVCFVMPHAPTTRYVGEADLDLGPVRSFLDRFLRGDLPFQARSQPLQAVQAKQSPSFVRWLVGSTYLAWLAEHATKLRVVFLFRAEANCVECAPRLAEWEKRLFGLEQVQLPWNVDIGDIVQFAIMDCTDNDPPANVDVHQWPRHGMYGPNQTQPIMGNQQDALDSVRRAVEARIAALQKNAKDEL